MSQQAPPVKTVLTKGDLLILSQWLDQALESPLEMREVWLDTLPKQFAHLKPKLLIWLGGEDPDFESFLITMPKSAVDSLTSAPEAVDFAGRIVGPYRLERRIGVGGMSTVWLADRTDAQIRRPVALKLPYVQIGSRNFIDRFSREKDILATLTHPNIARLYDAGVSDGQPYMAMEYIDGVSLLEFCDAHLLTVRARVAIFMQVLTTVQFAHSRLVIHRDLKPSNMLVSVDHRVHLLDFGIAKLMTDGAAEQTLLTRVHGRALTPEYAAPEQFAGSTLNTGCDVYALGVVLYNLLTGISPYQLKRQSQAALEEAIINRDPPAPSRASFDESCARARSTSSRKLIRELRGDLDTIALRALKKRVEDRYSTVDLMAQDLQSFLEGKAVLARADGLVYKVGRFLRYHRLLVAATTGIVLALSAGLFVAIWQARAARIETQRARVMQDFLSNVFRANSVDQMDPLKGRHTTAEQLLDAGASRIGDSLKDYPLAQAEMMSTLSDMYYELGLEDKASDLRLQRVAALRSVYGEADPRVAEAFLDAASSLDDSSRHTLALPQIKAAKDILNGIGDRSSPVRGRLLLQLTRFYRSSAAPSAIHYAQQGVEIFERADPDDNLIEIRRIGGQAYRNMGDNVRAKEWLASALATVNTKHPGDDAWLMAPVTEMAQVEAALQEIPAAEQHFREALSRVRRMNGNRHPQTLWIQLLAGDFLHETFRRSEGRALIATVTRAANGADGEPPVTMRPQFFGKLAAASYRDGRLEEAESLYIQDLKIQREQYPGTVALAHSLDEQANVLTALGKFSQAARLFDEALDTWHMATEHAAESATDNRYHFGMVRLALATAAPQKASAILDEIKPSAQTASLPLTVDEVMTKELRAEVWLALGKNDDALAEASGAVSLVQRASVRAYFQSLEAQALLTQGKALLRLGQAEEARLLLAAALALREGNQYSLSPWVAEAKIAYADALRAGGNGKDSRLALLDAQRILSAHPDIGEQFLKPLQEDLLWMQQTDKRGTAPRQFLR